MNTLVNSYIRSALKILGTFLLTHGYVTGGNLLSKQDVIGAILALAGVVLSHLSHTDDAPAASQTKMPFGLILAATVPAFLLTGCTSVINAPQGKILSVTERGIGLEVAQSTQTETPEVKFGFFSSAVVILPTSTNGPTYSPNFANTFDFAQSGALQMGIGENIASGNYQANSPGATNSAVAVLPIVPK